VAHSEHRSEDDLPKIEPPDKPSPGIAALPVWAQYEIRGLRADVERLREALEDTTEYVRLGMTWIIDRDRHVKMKRAWERGRKALDG
jgi:hypothetical protein